MKRRSRSTFPIPNNGCRSGNRINMSDDFSGDDDFDAGDADSALCHPCPVGDIKKGGHIAIKGLNIPSFTSNFIFTYSFHIVRSSRPCR